jgi:hypothetical protein
MKLNGSGQSAGPPPSATDSLTADRESSRPEDAVGIWAARRASTNAPWRAAINLVEIAATT